MNQVDIIIVNWNSGAHLKACINSIEQYGGPNVGKVVVVDNHSSDDSVHLLKGTKIAFNIIHAGQNLGFGKACNLGARECTSPFLLFLNPDARLMPEAIDRCVSFMNSEKALQVGICGVRLLAPDNTTQRHCARFPSVSTYFGYSTGLGALVPSRLPPMQMWDFDHESSREVDHVIGAYFFVRNSLFRSLHGFDERFFVYLEDLDFSLRARSLGFKTYYMADATAYHQGGGSSDQIKATRLFYSLRSRLIFAFIHFNRLDAWLITLMTILVEPGPRLVRAVLRGSWQEARDTYGAYRMLLRTLPTLINASGSQHA